MKFTTVIAVMGSADALTLNQMAEIYKQVYQRPANDLLTMVDDGETGVAGATAAPAATNATVAAAPAAATALPGTDVAEGSATAAASGSGLA